MAPSLNASILINTLVVGSIVLLGVVGYIFGMQQTKEGGNDNPYKKEEPVDEPVEEPVEEQKTPATEVYEAPQVEAIIQKA